MEFDELYNQIEQGHILPEQIYNLDMEYPQSFSIDYYKNNPQDNIDLEQKLQILFLDIEVFSNFTGKFLPPECASPISAITIYSTFEKTYHMYGLLLSNNAVKFPKEQIEEVRQNYLKELRDAEYLKDDEDIEIHLFYNNELNLLNTCWDHIRELDPAIISGFNSDRYDYPYIYNRLKKLCNNDTKKVNNILSPLGFVKEHKMGKDSFCKIAGLPCLDMRHLYVPRDEGGLVI
jgi:DNA polymerase elongation subunit (family B)